MHQIPLARSLTNRGSLERKRKHERHVTPLNGAQKNRTVERRALFSCRRKGRDQPAEAERLADALAFTDALTWTEASACALMEI